MQLKTTVQTEILSNIERLEKDATLYQEINFNLRAQAIDYIELHIVDRIDALTGKTDVVDGMDALKQYAKKVTSDLEGVNTRMFHQLRKKISRGGYSKTSLMSLIDAYLDYNLGTLLQQDITGYDDLDIFLNGLVANQKVPGETKVREPGMVYYQKTPARIIFELIKRAEFKPTDVFFDLGSGLGQATILVNLLTSIVSKGIEYEPAFCNYAKACAADLKLNDVDFINTDARYADYSLGNVFFMYTPFEGKMLLDVLQNLCGQAKKRKIKIFTYGSCTREVAQENWVAAKSNCQDELGEFVSV